MWPKMKTIKTKEERGNCFIDNRKMKANFRKVIAFLNVFIDGLSKCNLGSSICGGIFWDYKAYFLGAFGLSLGTNTAYFAEIGSYVGYWICSWQGLVSSLARKRLYFQSFVRSSMGIHNKWLNCCNLLNSMAFRFCHIFWETNYVADHLANLSLICNSLTWWQTPP